MFCMDSNTPRGACWSHHKEESGVFTVTIVASEEHVCGKMLWHYSAIISPIRTSRVYLTAYWEAACNNDFHTIHCLNLRTTNFHCRTRLISNLHWLTLNPVWSFCFNLLLITASQHILSADKASWCSRTSIIVTYWRKSLRSADLSENKCQNRLGIGLDWGFLRFRFFH